MLYKTQHIINNNLINLSYNTLETTIKYIPQKPIEKKPKYDKNDDFLFWIFFIFVKGEMEFEYIKKQKYTVAQEFKIKALLKIKNTKFNNRKLVKSKIINNLCHEKNISLMTLAALCFIYEINILYCVNGVKYYNLGDDCVEDINILINDHGNINFIKNAKKEDIEKYTQNTIKMESFEEKLKSLSSYKLPDLQNIASILKINVKNKSKNTLYDEIQKIL
tara:strand:- start:85 stop:744 length:660 start_codon:yes stop_codon:yes gene_type:complete